MYFYVIYIDFGEFRKLELAEIDEEGASNAACKVVQAENKELIVNPDCFVGIILDHIYGTVGIPDTMRGCFDIWTERARPLNVSQYEPNSSGLNVFTEKAIYYVVYQGDNNELLNELATTKPLLNITSREYTNFFTYMRRRSSSSKRRGSSSISKSLSKCSQLLKSLTSKSSKGSMPQSQSSKDKRSKSSKSLV